MNLFMSRLGRATCNRNLNFCPETSQEGIEFTKAREYLRAYCLNMNNVSESNGAVANKVASANEHGRVSLLYSLLYV